MANREILDGLKDQSLLAMESWKYKKKILEYPVRYKDFSICENWNKLILGLLKKLVQKRVPTM
jgi:hypothetical protein